MKTLCAVTTELRIGPAFSLLSAPDGNAVVSSSAGDRLAGPRQRRNDGGVAAENVTCGGSAIDNQIESAPVIVCDELRGDIGHPLRWDDLTFAGDSLARDANPSAFDGTPSAP